MSIFIILQSPFNPNSKMEQFKLRQLVNNAASWQLAFAILTLIGAVLSLTSNGLSALFSIATGVFILLSATAAQRYSQTGNNSELLTSFKHEKTYFILTVVYSSLLLLFLIGAVIYFSFFNDDWREILDKITEELSR